MGTSRQHREISVPIAETVFGSLETPASELPPLSDAIDLDALESLVPTEASRDVTVVFSYEGLRVIVHSGRVVCVQSDRRDGEWPLDVDAADEQ